MRAPRRSAGAWCFNAVAGDHNAYTGGNGSDFFDFRDANLNNTDTLTGGNGAGTDSCGS